MAEVKPGVNRWRLAFFLSAAVNLMIVGVVVGAVMRGPPKGFEMVRDLGFGPYSAALSEEDRKELRKAFRALFPDPKAVRRLMRDDLDAVLQALRADPFQPEILEAALARQKQRLREKLDQGQDLLRDRLVAMSVAERREFADRLEASLLRGHKHD